MRYLRFCPILLISLATVVLAACGSSPVNLASESDARLDGLENGMATVCYYFEMQSNTTKAVVEDALGREITNAELDELAMPHEIAFKEKYPRPTTRQQMQVDLYTYCDFNSLTTEQQAKILEVSEEILGWQSNP